MMASVSALKSITLAKVRDVLKAEVLNGGDFSTKVEAVGASDLLSDVLAMSQMGALLITGLVSPQVIRTAIVADLCGIVFVRGKRPGPEILSLAQESKIPVLATEMKMFEAAGRLYAALNEDK
jgi:predicted transcriptional regulator